MKAKVRILISVGTRPEIIKMVPVYFELQKRGLSPLWLHTGQHDEMARFLYKFWGITPDYEIELQRKPRDKNDCDLALLTALLLEKISRVLLEAKPDIVMVHGDTSTALATALAAFYQKRRIVHVEAGLRSGDEHHPFPEEKNRILIAQLAHMHFTPTVRSKDNLAGEGIASPTIHMVGNTIVQAIHLGAQMLDAKGIESPIITTLSRQALGKRMILVTAHRRENHGAGISNISQAVATLLANNPDLMVVWPIHPNPVVKERVGEVADNLPASSRARLHLTDPLDYPSLLWVLKHSWMVLTDSGGIQEEAVSLQVPLLVLRETTERPEVIDTGAGILVGTDVDRIVKTFEEVQADASCYQKMRVSDNPFGDDLVAARICDIML